MRTEPQQSASASGEMSRREMVAALARWTVPTVLTLSLGARAAFAQASCPPCTQNVGQSCKACSTRKINSCGCEPCLGPDYCPPSGVAPYSPTSDQSVPTADQVRARAELERALFRTRSGLGSELVVPSPFGRTGRGTSDSLFGGTARSPFGGGTGATTLEAQRLRNQAAARQGLYERLREFDTRRRP